MYKDFEILKRHDWVKKEIFQSSSFQKAAVHKNKRLWKSTLSKIRCSRLALVKNWSNLGQFPTPCPKNKSNYIPPRIFLHFSKIFLIFRDGCWPSVKFLTPPYTPGRPVIKHDIKKLLIARDDYCLVCRANFLKASAK